MTYLGNDWTEMIATTTWKVGGNTFQNIQLSNAKTAYINEIVNPAENTTYQDEIGLMYVSDYMYAASPAYWSYKGSDTATTDYRAAMNENWMLSWVHEWTITRSSNDTSRAFDIVSSGYIGRVGIDGSAGVRPVFNLKSSVVWMGGDGSKNLPYRIGI